MLYYCLKCRKNTESINLRVSKTNNGKTMILSKYAICGSKKTRFIKKQEGNGILSNLDLKAPLNVIPLLGDILFRIIKNAYQRSLASMVYKFFDKKSASLADKSAAGSGVANNRIKQNLQLAKELHKPIIRNFKKRTVYSGFKDNIWGADLADMQLISKFNKGTRFLLCVIDIFVNMHGLFL